MKALIDKYIEYNYKKLVCIAQNFCNEFGSESDGESLVSVAYLEVIENPPKFDKDIERYLVQAIKLEAIYPNSKTNRDIRGKEYSDPCERQEGLNNIEEHLVLMDWETAYNDFMDDLTVLEQSVCRVYFEKGIRSIRELSRHFDIPRTSLHEQIKETLNKIKEFERRFYED